MELEADFAVAEPYPESEGILKPELVFGLAAPVGTDLRALRTALQERLDAFKYDCVHIRVSDLIKQYCEKDVREQIESAKEEERISLLMAAGDHLRDSVNRGDALVPLIVTAIRAAREKIKSKSGSTNIPADNVCFIVDSLKHPHEVATLRGMYGDNFVLISGFASKDHRKDRLCDAIARSHLSTRNEDFAKQAELLIATDAKRSGSKIGQSLRDAFPLADFFIRVSGDFTKSLDRFLDIYFGSPYLTPYPDEYFMFEATAKALRSSDLSRQVGAVVVDQSNHMLSAGCNEVPMAGGGSYWPGMNGGSDNRDFAKGRDFNAVKKFEIINELVSFLNTAGVLKLDDDISEDDFSRALLFGKHKGQFKDLRVSNLIEFGRVVHAEMNAITEAARRGVAVGGGILYCTTFPCHMCARHIISSGIQRVVYIEPYPKSMTEELFPETVLVDRETVSGDRTQRAGDAHPPVSFVPFEGVAPSLYTGLFRAGADARKNSQGYIVPWARREAMPKIASRSTYLELEQAVATEVANLKKVSKEAVQRHQ